MPGLSNWREEFNLSEVVTGKMTDKEALKKVSEKDNINNKVTINPKLDEAVKEIGGEVISMVEQDTTAQKQRIDMKQMILDRQKLKLRRKDLSAAKKEKKEGEEGESTNAMKQANVIAQEETVKQVNEKKRKNALQIQKIVGEGVALDAFNKITDKEKRDKNKKELARLMAIYNHQKDLKKRGLSNSYEPEGESLDERLGGKGYQPYTNLRGEKISGDWEDSDRGKGNKAKKRAGGKVEKKSPTYKAHVLNKEEVVSEGDVHSGQGEKIQKRTKAWMDKKGQKGAPGLDAMKARTAEHKAKRGVKEEVVDEGLGASMAVTAGLNAVGNIAKAYGASQAAKGAIVGGALSGAGALGGGVLNYMASRNNNKKKSDVKPQEKKKEVKEGVMKMVKKVMSKKKPEKKKATMDAITSKVHDWRKRNSDKQKEHEKYVNFLPVDEAKVDDVKYSKDEKRKNYETDVHTLSVNKGVRADRNKRRSATDVIFHGHSKVERDRKQAHYKSRGVKTKGVKEDKAFEFVKNKLKAKYGDGVLATGEKMKPPTAAQKKAAAAHQAKVDKENAAERAKDPSQGRYPRG